MQEEDVFVTAGRDKQVFLSFSVAKGDSLVTLSLGQSVGSRYLRDLRLQMCLDVKGERCGYGCRCEQDG